MRRADREVTDRNQLEEILKACHSTKWLHLNTIF